MNRHLTHLINVAIASVTLLLPLSGVFAADPPSAGAIKDPFKQAPLQVPKGTLPAPVAPAEKADKPQPPKSDKRISVRKFKISGNTLFKTEQLLDQIRELVGKQLTLEEIYAAADILTDFYRSKGFSLANVIVPAQRVSFGIIELQVIEGRISNVAFAGNKKYSNEFLNDYLDEERLGKAVSLDSLERELLLLNDLPGLTSRAVIRPGKELGSSEILLTSKEKPYSGRITLNNFGREEVGQWRVETEFSLLNPFGLGDQLTFGITKAEAGLLDFFNFAYSLPVGSQGARLGLTAAFIDYEVGEEFRVLDIKGLNRSYQLTYSHPYKRSRKQNILLGASVLHNESRTSTLDVTTTNTEISLLELSVLLNQVHNDNSVTTASAAFATNFRENDGGDDTGLETKLTLDIAHVRPLIDKWSLFARASAVLATDELPDTQKFSIGGQGSIRGFPSSEVRGDEGIQTTLELRRAFILGESTPATFKAFHDIGKVYRKKPAGEETTESLSSFGVGLSLIPTRNWSVDMEYVLSTNNHEASDGEDVGRYWFNTSVTF